MKSRVITLLAVAFALALFPATLQAGTITYNLGSCPTSGPCSGTTSSSVTYASGGINIAATGYATDHTTPTNSTTDLYIKNPPAYTGDEIGLGIAAPDDDHEIESGQFIQLDLTNLASAGFDSGTLLLGSVQGGERYSVCESGAAGAQGSLNCKTGGENGTTEEASVPIVWSTADPYIDITVPTEGGDILVSSLAVATPEPGTAGLMLIGIGGLLIFTLRRRLAATV